MTSEPPRIVERSRIFKGWNSFDLITVEEPGEDGSPQQHVREIVDHGEAAVVLTIDRTRGVALLVRQWRAGLLAIPCVKP